MAIGGGPADRLLPSNIIPICKTDEEWENKTGFSPRHFLLGFRKGVLINSIYAESMNSIEYVNIIDDRAVIDLTFSMDLNDSNPEKLRLKTFIEDNFPVIVRHMSYAEMQFL